ncbi:MAG: 5'-nucleotidase [Cellvibrionales bacterium]|nr:5'-nucleotidase [Cellvibrionales bacterium]
MVSETDEHLGRLVIAISSSALFDLTECNRIFEEQGVDAYSAYQVAHENAVLQPGEAFSLVKKLLAVNQRIEESLVEVILLSRNNADSGLRVFNSIEHHELAISRAAFCGGLDPWRYIRAFNCDLFLSANGEDVRAALEQGVAAATMLASAAATARDDDMLRFAFDGDAVLFSDESERIYKSAGLAAFAENEQRAAEQPLSGGPFRNFLGSLQRLQARFDPRDCPLRTALVTARSAPAHERVIKTLRDWNVRLDESLFLGGMPKGEFLKAYGADVFFDDQRIHCDSASQFVATGHVPSGVANGE